MDSGFRWERSRIQSFLRKTQAFRKVGNVLKDGDTPVDVVSLSHDKTTNTRAVKVTRVGRCFSTARGPLSLAGLGGLRLQFPGGRSPRMAVFFGRCRGRGDWLRGKGRTLTVTWIETAEEGGVCGTGRSPCRMCGVGQCVYAMFRGLQELEEAGSSVVS